MKARGRNGMFTVTDVNMEIVDGKAFDFDPDKDDDIIAVEMFSKNVAQTRTPPVIILMSIEEAIKFAKDILDKLGEDIRTDMLRAAYRI